MTKPKNEHIVLNKGDDEIELDYSELRKAVLVLRAVNHDLRKKIIALLEEHDQLTVTDIYVKLRLEQSVASQHLAILRKARIVQPSRDGKFIYYALDKERIQQISELIGDLAE
jgi:DNA-binding transcriptional ArsR family regulator